MTEHTARTSIPFYFYLAAFSHDWVIGNFSKTSKLLVGCVCEYLQEISKAKKFSANAEITFYLVYRNEPLFLKEFGIQTPNEASHIAICIKRLKSYELLSLCCTF